MLYFDGGAGSRRYLERRFEEGGLDPFLKRRRICKSPINRITFSSSNKKFLKTNLYTKPL